MSFRTCAAAVLCLFVTTTAVAQHAHPSAEKLGTVHFQTSCRADVAPRFDRAVALLHSFEFGSAIRGFSEVAAADSTCAMAHWGIALARWNNPFTSNIRPPAQLALGQAAVSSATRLRARASDRERGFIDAVALLYANTDRLDQLGRLRAYADAMRALTERQPADTEARIFYALALAQSAPPTDKTYTNQLQAGAILEPLWAALPDHPGLAHYIIHTYDFPPLADKARAAARRYADIAPSAAHALHMPSHTFTRVGMWNESVATNQRSVESALAGGAIAEALHASDYMMYAYLQMRDEASAGRVLASLPPLRDKFDVNAVVGAAPGSAGVFALAAIPARWVMERRAWNEATALLVSPSDFPYAEAMTYFVRALGTAHMGDLASTRQAIDSLAAIRDRLLATSEGYWAEQVAIQHLGAQAWLAYAEHDRTRALDLMRQAARREDATEKSAVTPGPLAPAHELLGDMLMDMRRPDDALAEYRATLTREPNRYRALLGAAQSARAAGDAQAEATYAKQLAELTAKT